MPKTRKQKDNKNLKDDKSVIEELRSLEKKNKHLTGNTNETNVSSGPSTESSNSECCSRHRSETFDIGIKSDIKEILVRLTTFQNTLQKLEEKMTAVEKRLANREKKKVVRKIGSVTQDELLVFGLPAHSREALNKLEESLSDESYSHQLVSENSTIIYYMLS